MKKARQKSTNADAVQRAVHHHQKGELLQAEAIYREVLRVEPKNADALHLLGMIAHQVGKNEAAIELIEKAIAVNRAVPIYHSNAGVVYHTLNRLDKAIACYRRALSLNSNDHMALTNLGTALKDQGKLEEAIACHQRALSLKPDYYLAHTNLGSVLQDQGKIEDAIVCYQHALSINPDDHLAHFNLSVIHLLKGNLKEGWEGFKYRFLRQDISRYFNPKYLNLFQPQWDGSAIKGRTILLYAEQGFGDTIQFIRYVPMVLQKCDKIIVTCQEELISLMQRINGIHDVVAHGQKLPDFDFHCPLLNLPSIFNTTLETVPATITYINTDTQKVLKWRERLQSDSARLKIGLCWAGNPTHKNDRNRSISLSMFSMLGDMENITFYSLQKGKAAEQAKNPPKGMSLVDFTDDLNDFSDTAALIENLDLIISVDTAIVHLSGALGKPVWTLLPFMPDWRWLLDRDDTPWYPTMRLFRQSSTRDWSHVIISVKDALAHIERLGPVCKP